MKHSLAAFFVLFTISLIAQNSSNYEQVLLDGKTAYINVKTGAITKEKPKGIVNRPNLAAPVNTVNSISEVNVGNHTVAKGETLYAISKKHGVTIAQLKEYNPNIDINTLSIGQKLNITNNTSSSTTTATDVSPTNNYVVEKGDTLYSISKKFNTTVSELKAINNLSSNVLSIGQSLIVK